MNCILRALSPVVFFIFGVNASCYAQNGTTSIKYLGVENGLSNNVVNSLYTDRFGFMWMGTYDGLNRYDGYDFKIFRNKWGNENSLIYNHILTLTGDQKDRIWIGTQRGVSFFDYEDSQIHPLGYVNGSQKNKITASINSIVVHKSGSVYIGADEKGLFVLRNGSKVATQIPLGKKFNFTVKAISIDDQQNIWLFIKDIGLCRYRENDPEILIVNKEVTEVTHMISGRKDTLWIGTAKGLYFYMQKDHRLKQFPYALSNENVMGLCFGRDQKLWIATDGGGITVYDSEKQAVTYLKAGKEKGLLSSNSIGYIYEDKESRKWIATLRGGVNIIDHKNTQFTTIKNDPFQPNSLVNNFVLSFCEDAQHRIWIGTDGGGLSRWDPLTNQYKNYVRNPQDPGSLTSNFVTSILKDAKNEIWIATFNGGIDRFDAATQSFKHYNCHNTTKGIDEINLWKLYEDRQGNLWAGTTKGGALYRLNRKTDKFELFDERLKDIHTIYQDAEGVLWAGNYTHLIKIDVTHKKHSYILVNFAIRAIHEDREHHLWIGTEGGGLLNYDRKNREFKRYIESNGLPSNSILNILEDNSGNLWCSTYNGLSKFNIRKNAFKNYFATDGLQSSQFNYNAAFKLSNGAFLFGGNNGFNKFFPDSMTVNRRIPKIVLTDFRVNNIPIDEQSGSRKETAVVTLDKITIPYSSAVISVNYAAIEFSFQDQIRYAYYLEGWDRNWNYVDRLKTAYYSRLNEGTYKLRIKSTDTDGAWSTNEKVIVITVLPPWFRTWWAYTLYVLLFSGIYSVFLIYRKRQLLLKNQVEITHLKMEQEKAMNENKLNFFTNISHELRTPLTLIVNPIKDILNSKEAGQEKNDLNIVYRNSRRLLSLVDQLLLFRKTESETEPLNSVCISLHTFAKEIFLCFSYLAKNNNIDYIFECGEGEVHIYADREKLEIVLFNLLSNALKFTPKGGFVKLQIGVASGQVCIEVIDSGQGIPEDVGEKLFDKFYKVGKNESLKIGFGIGLYLVRNFVELHKGKISYFKNEIQGTTFRVELPEGEAEESSPYSVSRTDLTYVNELLERLGEEEIGEAEDSGNLELLISDFHSILVVDDNDEIVDYIKQIFQHNFKIYKANNGIDGLQISRESLPDIIISDINMEGLNGIDFCRAIKDDAALSHIPVILLTGDPSPEVKLKGMEAGAYDFISKPFDRDFFIAKINSVIKNRTNLQSYFYNEITLKSDTHKVSEGDKGFLQKCITLIEDNLTEADFNVKTLASALSMSHSNLYKKIKSTSGQSVNSFIRFIRLRKAAELLINTNLNVNEAAYQVGIYDMKYFREQFQKLFKLTPSEFVKKHRKNFNRHYSIQKHV